ncbi:MAG TPA: metal-sensitive transcriptional regulator [Candidatus Saccharimonadales bacterium]|nr:metal-sensitive transcriptional regulator [Candidatus Saccharimonadales bacterium]
MKDQEHHGYYDNKDQVLKRLRRAEGQVRGIARMVTEDTYCIDILTQIGAAQAALNKVALELVRDHSKHCMADATLTDAERAVKADELVSAVGRLLAK